MAANLRERATELRSTGLTAHRAFRVLRKEFPHAERDAVVDAARLPGYRTGVMPFWTQTGGNLLRPVICKKPPKGAPA